jgi:hypothetical protein
MVTVEIGRALSDDEDDVVYMEQPPTQRPLAPVKCESDSVVSVAASNGAGGDRRQNDGDDDDGGLKPATTGERNKIGHEMSRSLFELAIYIWYSRLTT